MALSRSVLRLLPLAALMASAVIAAASLYQAVTAHRAPPAVTANPALPSAAKPPAAPAVLDSLGEMFQARPLFDASRRPPLPKPPTQMTVTPPAPITMPPPPPKPPPPTVLGVTISATRRVALVRLANEAQPRSMEPGQTAGGWSVIAVQVGQVQFAYGEDVLDRPVFPPLPSHPFPTHAATLRAGAPRDASSPVASVTAASP